LEEYASYERELLGRCYPFRFHKHHMMPKAILREKAADDYTGNA
jgi:hypothetical protein